MRAAVAISLKAFLILFYLITPAVAQSTQTIDNTQSWLIGGGDNLVETKSTGKREKILKSESYANQCEQYNFDLFFMLFSEDKYFQESTTIFPLKITTLSPKEAITEDEISKSEYFTIKRSFWIKQKEGAGINIFPNRHQRTIDNLYYSIETDSPDYGMNSVVLRKEGTGMNYRFVFIWKGCWFLSEYEDNSI